MKRRYSWPLWSLAGLVVLLIALHIALPYLVRDYLNDKFMLARAIRYEIHYRTVSDGRKDTVLVDYTYSASYKIPTTHGDVWRRRVADNRLTLLREGENFRILAGM